MVTVTTHLSQHRKAQRGEGLSQGLTVSNWWGGAHPTPVCPQPPSASWPLSLTCTDTGHGQGRLHRAGRVMPRPGEVHQAPVILSHRAGPCHLRETPESTRSCRRSVVLRKKRGLGRTDEDTMG